jgi:hypothetical protein
MVSQEGFDFPGNLRGSPDWHEDCIKQGSLYGRPGKTQMEEDMPKKPKKPKAK